jgi:hypothetical protein
MIGWEPDLIELTMTGLFFVLPCSSSTRDSSNWFLMKKLLIALTATALLFTGAAFVGNPTAEARVASFSGPKSYFDVRFENKCSNDVKLRIEAFGSASEGTLYKKSYESHPGQAGYKIYVDGKFFREMKEEDAGKTFVVCE